MDSKTKIETLIKNKFKSFTLKLDSNYSQGEVVVKKVTLSTNYHGQPSTLHLQLQFKGETKGGTWMSPQYKGRRRNQEITNKICWQDNDIKLLARVFGIRYVEVEKIIVKK